MAATILAPQPFRKSGVQDQFKQKLAIPYPAHLVSMGQSSIRPRCGPGFRRSSPKIQRLAESFRSGDCFPLKTFQKLLGLMAEASTVVPLGLLHMQPLQHWLSHEVPRRLPHPQGEPQLYQDLGPLEITQSVSVGGGSSSQNSWGTMFWSGWTIRQWST